MTAKEYEILRNKFITETLKLSDQKRIETPKGITKLTYCGTLKISVRH